MPNRTQVAGRLATLPAPIVTAVTPGYNGPTVPISYEQANGFQEAVCVPLEDGSVVLDKNNYTQFATLLSGVHGIVTNIRTTLATVAVSTFAKKAAIAVTDAICSGTNSVCSAGVDQIASGLASQCNAGATQIASGGASQCNAGGNQTVSGNYSQCNAGLGQTVSGLNSQCNAGGTQIASGIASQCNAGIGQYNDGSRSSIIGGQYIENIDNDCLAFGVGTSTPPTAEVYGDTVTNKNVMCKIHCDTGMIDQKGIEKTCAVTLDGSGLTPAAVTWTDYNNEALMQVRCLVTCDGSAHTIVHGQSFEFALPGWALIGDVRQVSELQVTPPTTVATPFVWGLQTNYSSDMAMIYFAGPAFTVSATETFALTCNFHRIHIPTSSYSP